MNTYKVVTLFCGLGGKTLGFVRARSERGSRFESIAAFDVDKDACTDFELLTGSKATQADLGSLTPSDLRELCPQRPDVVIGSPPCKGFSGCLPMGMAKTKKYQDLNALALYSLDLVLEAWDKPPAFILWENVPRMLNRGATLLRRAKALLREKGYEVDLRVHDCGELGGLAQSRGRVLLVARHRELAPTPLLRPPPQGLRSMGSVLWDLPVPTPNSTDGGPMHRLPRLSTLNWVRLAAIRAGRDWRDLPAKIHMAGDPRLAPRAARQNGGFGVNDSTIAGHTVLADGSVRNTWASVADPRLASTHRLVAGQPLDVSREDWVAGTFELLGDRLDVERKGSPGHVIIVAPDGTVHRPLTTLELAMLQGLPVWHRPGDPRELVIGEPGGQWLELSGTSQARWRERIGNAVPPPTAQAIAEQVLGILDEGTDEVFRLSASGVWVEQERVAASL